MKLFVVIVLVAVFAGAQAAMNEEQKAKANEIKMACAAELKIPPEDLAKMKPGMDMSTLGPEYKCFPKCMMEKNGIMSADGKLNEAVAIEQFSAMLNKPTAEAMVNQCKSMSGADPCETALKFFECTTKIKPNP